MPFIFNFNVQGIKKATDNINCHFRDIKIKKMKTATSPSQRQIYWPREERYVLHNISVIHKKFFGHFTEDTSSRHTDYRVLKAWEMGIASVSDTL